MPLFLFTVIIFNENYKITLKIESMATTCLTIVIQRQYKALLEYFNL